MKIPRRDLLIGSASIKLPPVSAQELTDLERFIVLASIVLLPALLLGLWILATYPVGGGALLLISGTAMAVLIGSTRNYDRITTEQAMVLSQFLNEGLLLDAGVQFIRRVAALNRELTSSEASQLIKLAQREEKNRQHKGLYEAAESRGNGVE